MSQLCASAADVSGRTPLTENGLNTRCVDFSRFRSASGVSLPCRRSRVRAPSSAPKVRGRLVVEAVMARRPDSRLARQAEDLIRSVQPLFLTNHAFRSHFFAVALADRDQIGFDTELLYVAALLHDIGLVEEFDAGACFEEDGAAAATRLASLEGWPPERSHALAEAIRLHARRRSSWATGRRPSSSGTRRGSTSGATATAT